MENEKQSPVFKYVSFSIQEKAVELPALATKISDPANPERVVRFRASDDTLDRSDEVIMQDGWDLKDWIANPVIMQFHDYSMWPVGRGVAVGITDGALMIDVEFDPPEVDESADMVFRKVKHGSVKAGSVGFLPTQWITPGQKGTDLFTKYPGARRIYVKQSLLEFTICPIPANPSALAASMAKRYEKHLGHDESTSGTPPPSLSGKLGDVAAKIAEIRLNTRKGNV